MFPRISSPLAAALALSVYLSFSPLVQAQTWDGGGTDNYWNTANNWNPDGVPATGANLVFSGGARMTNINDLVDFTAGSGSNALGFNNANPYHLSGNALKLNGNIYFGAAVLTSSVTHEIALDLALQRAVTISTSTTGFGNLKISGAITGNFTIQKSVVGDLELTGTNSFGNLTISGGRVLISTIANGGSNSALGAGSLVQIGASTTNGTLVYTGATASTDRQIQIGQASATVTVTGAGSVLNEGTGELTFTNAAFNRSVTQNTTISRTLTIGGTGNVTIQGQIANNSAGAAINIEKSGSGRLTLSGSNTYTGTTSISAGIIRVSSATALGTTAGGVSVASGSALELTGGITIGAESLGLSGSGISSGGALRNISGSNTYQGAITLNSDSRINSDADTLTLSANITGVHNLTIGGAGNSTASGVIGTSTGMLTKDGTGTLILSGGNTYSGGTVFNAGTIQVGNANALNSSGNLTFGGGALRYGTGITEDFSSRIKNSGSAIIIDTNGENITFGSVVDSSNTGGLTKNGTGDLTLSGANAFTGNVTLNTGRLILGNDSAMGGATGSIVIYSGTLDVTAARTLSGNKAQNWNGNFTFGGSNTLNMGSGAVTLGANSTVTVSASTLTVGGDVSGTGFGLAKSGAGSLVLSGSNSYTGATTINSGTVVFDGANALSASTSLLNAGTATLSFLDGATNNITTSGGLTLNNSTFIFDLSGASADRLNFGGSATLSGTNTININFLSAASAGNFTLFTAAGGLNSSWSLDPSVIQSGFTFTLDQSSATQLVLVVASSSSGRYWTGEASNNWSGVNFSTTSGGSATLSGADLDGDSDLIFAGDAPSNLATVISSNYTVGSLAVSTPGVSINGSYTITANKTGDATYSVTVASGTTNIGASLAGAGAGLTMAGGGTLALNASNTYGGNTTITSGTLAINNANAISNGTLIIAGGSLNNTSGGAITLATNNAQSWNGDFTFVGTNDLNLGTGGVTLGATRSVSITAGNLTVGGNIGATAFGLTKEGAGTLVLSGSNAYTGTTTINAGTLRISGGNAISDSGAVILANAAGVGFQVNSSETIASLQGGGSTGGTVTVASGQTLTVAESGSQTFSGVIGGAGGLTKSGSGTITLDGASTYSGGTTITAGTLSIGAGGTTGSLSTSSTIVNNGALAFNRSNTLTQGTDFTASAITGTGALIQNGSGTTILTANQGYTGATIINAGTLQIGNGGTSGSLSSSSAITNNGTLAFNRSDDITQGTHFSANITGTGALVKNGSGNLTIGVANSYTGGTVINSGTLQIRNASALGTSGTISFGGGTLQWGNVTTDLSSRFSTAGGQDFKLDVLSGNVVINSAINNAGGTLTKSGSGSLRLATNLSGSNTLASIVVNSGTLSGANNANTFGGAGANITMNGGSLSFFTNSEATGNYSNNDLFIQGGASIVNSDAAGSTATYYKFGNLTIGTNTLTIAPTNAGGVSDAKITITKATTLTGNATFNITDRANNILALNGIAQSGGTRNLIKEGAGKLQITGSSSFTGTTTINGGVVEAAASNALASTSEVIVNTGGSLLVTVDGALGANGITLNSTSTTVAGLAFNGTYNGSLGILTLSQDSIIDLGSGSVTAIFSQIAGLNTHTLSIYNWTGTTLWNGGDGNNTDQIYFASGASAHLDRISFYSDFGNSFLGTGYQFSSGSFANEVIPVPEPEAYATAVLLLLGCGWLYLRRKQRGHIQEIY